MHTIWLCTYERRWKEKEQEEEKKLPKTWNSPQFMKYPRYAVRNKVFIAAGILFDEIVLINFYRRITVSKWRY